VNMQKKAGLIVFMTVLMDLIGFGMVIPLVGLYGEHFQATTFQLGILGASYSMMQFLFAPIWGAASDKWGRRPIILISLLGAALSHLGFGLSGSIEVLILARALGGIFAANISTAQAAMADISTPENRTQSMGLIGAAFGLGFTLGPPLGGGLLKTFGASAPGLAAAAFCMLNFLLAIWLFPETRRQARESSPRTLKSLKQLSPLLQKLFLTSFSAVFAFALMEQVLPVFLARRFGWTLPQAGYQTGLLLLVVGVTAALTQGVFLRVWLKRCSEWPLIQLGLTLEGFAMLLMTSPSPPGLYFLYMIPLALGSSLFSPSLMSLISKQATEDEQGLILGLSQSLGSLARALGPSLGLWLIAGWLEAPFMLAAMVLFGLVLTLAFQKKTLSRPRPY
jgi:MFS transporter, DHA1 family, tetracycline resistance protein